MTDGLNTAAAANAYRATDELHKQHDHLLMHWRWMLFEGNDEQVQAAREKLVAHIVETETEIRGRIRRGDRFAMPKKGPVTGPGLAVPSHRVTLYLDARFADWDGFKFTFRDVDKMNGWRKLRHETNDRLMALVRPGYAGTIRGEVARNRREGRWEVTLTLEERET